MNNELSQAILAKVMSWSETEDIKYRSLLQTMASYKYDDYQQFSSGMRFIESLAQWLNRFESIAERKIAIDFIVDNLVFISNREMNQLVHGVYHDFIKKDLIEKVSNENDIARFKIKQITNSLEFKKLKRQCLFLGFSDGAKIEIFRRANATLSHEQIYQTYELSPSRAIKMQDELVKDLKKILNRDPTHTEAKFKKVYLIDDFTASGTSYIREENGSLVGKIKNISDELRTRTNIIDKSNFELNIIFYLCTNQAYDHIMRLVSKLPAPIPKIHAIYKFDDNLKIRSSDPIHELCLKDEYYDQDLLEDEHTKKGGNNVKLGFADCALPIILSHNTPNNSIPLLWSYAESKKFVGLFPRIPRHKE
jgi:hypothetical protein